MSLLRKGQQIAGYRVLGLLGHGNMGEVYLVKQTSMDRVVALKALSPRLLKKSPNFGRMFVNEARGVAQLGHPNIIAVHDAGVLQTDRGVLHYFAMEYVDGEDLDDILARETILEDETIGRIMRSIAAAIDYAARKGVVHRDIKPANIMITRDDHIKLADFGLIREAEADTDHKIVGTPSYMSPEQARGQRVDHRSDQYSLGCTLFQMLTGEVPYLGASTRDVLNMHKHAAIPDPGEFVDCDPRWRELCIRLMAKTPEERFAEPAELIAAIDEILRPQPSQAASKAIGHRRRRRAVRNRARVRKARARQSRRAPAVASSMSRSKAASRRRPSVRRQAVGRRRDTRAGTRMSTVSASAVESSVILSEDLHQPREARLGPALLWLPRRLWAGLRRTGELTHGVGAQIVTLLVLVLGWLIDRLIVMLPIIRDVLYWLVPHGARLYYLVAGMTWTVRIHGGHNHLLQAQDDDEGFVAAFLDGRHLPFVWQMTQPRFDTCKAVASRRWAGEWIRHQIERLVGALFDDRRDRARSLLRRLRDARVATKQGVPMSMDRERRGHCDDAIVAVAKAGGLRILPVACAARPAWLFRRSANRQMIPAPFATVHLVIGPPIPVRPDSDHSAIAETLEREMVDLQRYTDRIAQLANADPIREPD